MGTQARRPVPRIRSVGNATSPILDHQLYLPSEADSIRFYFAVFHGNDWGEAGGGDQNPSPVPFL